MGKTKPKSTREQVELLLEGFGDVWLQQEDGWVYIGPARMESGTAPKKLVCVGAKMKNDGWARAKWVWKMFTRKGDVEAAVRTAKKLGALEVKVRTCECDWTEETV